MELGEPGRVTSRLPTAPEEIQRFRHPLKEQAWHQRECYWLRAVAPWQPQDRSVTTPGAPPLFTERHQCCEHRWGATAAKWHTEQRVTPACAACPLAPPERGLHGQINRKNITNIVVFFSSQSIAHLKHSRIRSKEFPPPHKWSTVILPNNH